MPQSRSVGGQCSSRLRNWPSRAWMASSFWILGRWYSSQGCQVLSIMLFLHTSLKWGISSLLSFVQESDSPLIMEEEEIIGPTPRCFSQCSLMQTR